MRKAAIAAGATVKIVAPKIGGARLAGAERLAADGQIAGIPSMIFDAVAVMFSKAGAAIDFVGNDIGHLKTIAVDAGGRALLQAAGIMRNAGVVSAADATAFIKAAKNRQ